MVHEASSTGAGWIALLPHSMKVPGLNPSLHVLPLCPSFLPQAKHTQESLDATRHESEGCVFAPWTGDLSWVY